TPVFYNGEVIQTAHRLMLSRHAGANALSSDSIVSSSWILCVSTMLPPAHGSTFCLHRKLDSMLAPSANPNPIAASSCFHCTLQRPCHSAWIYRTIYYRFLNVVKAHLQLYA